MTVTEIPRRGPIARFGERHPVIVDVFIALSWLLFAAPVVLIAEGSWPLNVPAVSVYLATVLLVAAALVLFRRRRASVAFVVVLVVTLPFVMFVPVLSNLAAGYFVYGIALYENARRAWIAAAVSGAITVAASTAHVLVGLPLWDDTATSRLEASLTVGIFGILVLLVAVSFGQIAGGRRRYVLDLIAHAEEVARDRDQQVQFAALEERSRIARDMHDIVAHSISVVVRLADGAAAVLEDHPHKARQAIEQIGNTGRSSLAEMRRVIGMLDTELPDGAAAVGSRPDDLERLVGVYRGVGLPVELELDGELPAHSGLTAAVYRVTQEALTNALQHASSPKQVSVRIAAAHDDVTIAVRNDGVPGRPTRTARVGRGLVGMRERAELFGGRFAAGPDGDGYWLVSITLRAGTE